MGICFSCPCFGDAIDPIVLRAQCFKCGQACSMERKDFFLVRIIHWGKANGRVICSDCLYLTS